MPTPPMLVQAPAPPAPPAPPSLPPGLGVSVEIPGLPLGPLTGVPQTAQELAALRERRELLSDQLVSAANRREELAGELENATNAANRAGLEQRLQVLDQRIAQLETDMAETGRQLTAAPAHLLAESTTEAGPGPFGLESGQVTAISIVGTIFVGFPLAIAMARLMWKRATTPAPKLPAETTQRLQRMEQAVDAIAIEVERVSEGQRFLTRLFGDAGSPAALAAGQRAAERVPMGESRVEELRVPRAGA